MFGTEFHKNALTDVDYLHTVSETSGARDQQVNQAVGHRHDGVNAPGRIRGIDVCLSRSRFLIDHGIANL